MSAFSVPVMQFVCHVDYFCSWDDVRDKNEIAFFILGIESGGNKSYGLKWESRENIRTKMWFSPSM